MVVNSLTFHILLITSFFFASNSSGFSYAYTVMVSFLIFFQAISVASV